MQLRPTALGGKGALFFATVVLLFFATPYSNLFFLLTAFLAVLGLQSVSGSAANLRGLAVELRAANAAAAESGHDVELLLHAGKRPRFALRLALQTSAGELLLDHHRMVRGDAVVQARVPGLPRGVHTVTALVVDSSHPFGLCRARARHDVHAELVAHPIPAKLQPGREPRHWLGEGDQAHAGPGRDAIAGLRPFRTGDSLRDVHWKATARRRVPIVKEREGDLGDSIELVLDRRLDGEAFETSLSLATAVLLRAGEQQRCVQLRSQGHAAVYGPGQRPVAEALRWLAQAQSLPQHAAPPPQGAPTALRLPRRPREVARA